MTVRTCAVCGRIGTHPLIWYEEENPAGGVLSRFVEQAPSKEAKDVVCDECLPKVLELGIACCKQLSSMRQNPIGPLGPIVFFPEPVSSGIADGEPEQKPLQEAGAGVTGKGDVGGSMPMPVSGRGFDVVPGSSHCVARSDCGPHEPLELFPVPIHGGKLEGIEGGFFTGGTANLFSIGHGGMAQNIYVQVCKHCGALYAEVVTAEKKPEGA